MSSKAKTQSLLQGFFNSIERQFDTKVKTIQSNNGVEFIMSNFFQSTGYTSNHLLKHQNRKTLLKGSINIYSM